MLMGDKNGDTIRINEKDGLWAVQRGTPQWAGWVYWYRHELRKHFFPKWLTTLYEWPPTTQTGADAVAKWISDIRDSKYLKEQLTIGGAPVPSHPSPWNGGKVRLDADENVIW